MVMGLVDGVCLRAVKIGTMPLLIPLISGWCTNTCLVTPLLHLWCKQCACHGGLAAGAEPEQK
jgi:hypothetical protein